jgi:hypothetical protein
MSTSRGAWRGHRQGRAVDNSTQQRDETVLPKLVILETMQSLRVLEDGSLKERKKRKR